MRDHTALTEALRRHGLQRIPDMDCPCGGRMQATLHVANSTWDIRCARCGKGSSHGDLPAALFLYRMQDDCQAQPCPATM